MKKKMMPKAPAQTMPRPMARPPLAKGTKKVSTMSKHDKKVKDIEDHMGDKTF